MIPGLSAALPEEIMDADHEKTMRRIEAIINSMTPSERSKPQIISGSRRKRIAAGSGVTVEDVNQLLSQLEQMKKGMKQFSKLQSRQKKMKPRRFSR
jgi:signal recognition particle subunit SRP54